MRISTPIIAAFILAILPSAVSQAAKLSVVEGEGALDCLLELGGPDKLFVMGQQGGGFTTRVKLRFLGMLDVFPPTKELRLELTTWPGGRPEVFIGGVSELDMVPTFTASPAFLPLVAPRGSFTYVLEGRPVVMMDSPSPSDVDAFTTCVMNH